MYLDINKTCDSLENMDSENAYNQLNSNTITENLVTNVSLECARRALNNVINKVEGVRMT